MNASTILALKKAVELTRGAVEYIEHDQQVLLGLRKPQWIIFSGEDVVRPNFYNKYLSIEMVKGCKMRLAITAFSAWTKLWNGPDLIGNDLKDGSLESSLWHDFLWEFAKDIAEQWGCTPEAVMEWANGLFHAAWVAYGEMYPDAKLVHTKARVAYGVVQFSIPWYHRIRNAFLTLMRIVVFALLCINVLGYSGCSAFKPPPNYSVDSSSGLFGDENIEVVEPWNNPTNSAGK